MLALAIIVVALAVLVGVVFAFGGFDQRRYTFKLVSAGTVMPVGPFEYTFTEVTVQHDLGLGDPTWTAVAIGRGRLVGIVAEQPAYQARNFILIDSTQGISVQGRTSTVGPHTKGADLQVSDFTPGLPPEEYQVNFELPANYRPTGHLRLVVLALSYADHSYISTGGSKSWNPSGGGFTTWLPVTILATD